jgi:two-component system CheB/CheR fusion protein
LVVNLERRFQMNFLPDSEAVTLSARLKAYPLVTSIYISCDTLLQKRWSGNLMNGNLEQNSQPQVELEPPPRAASFPVIGLGASAGGLQALKDFFTHMPAESGMAFVVIMHLSPKHESHAAALLQATTEMPVTQVNESVRVSPNHVYVIPPTKNLEMSDGQINLTEPEPLHGGKQVAVDRFFRTLGDTHKQMAVGIVLSGMGSDGTNGLKRIKEQNGLAFAQDPKDAEHDSMPRHAINSGLVDFVLPVASMPDKLIEIWRNASRIKLPPETEPPPVVSQEDADEAALRDIFMLLRSHTGHDFTHYKRATVLRRIERRLQVNQLLELTAYRGFMREHPMEAQALLKDLLISVTNFFRDRAAFDELEREVVPLLFHEKTTGDQVRVWVAGCATGEEAYSVAMLLLEYAERLQSPPAIQVFATDIDEAAIATAREGSYTETIEADVSMERLRRFFTKEPGGYHIKKNVRERVLFTVHNLIKDPPFSKLDAISCRNLLIYLNREAQVHIFEVFHFVLLPNGFLFLGNSESAEGAANLFATADKKQRIFRAESVARARSRVPSLPLSVPLPQGSAPQTTGTRERQKISFGELHQKLLEQYAPPSVIINAAYDIVHLSDRAGRFLQFVGGEPSHNLLKVVHPELRIELRTVLFQATQSGKSFEARGVRIKRDEHDFYVNMIARPVSDDATGTAHNYFLVLFDEVEGLAGTESGVQSAGESEPVMRLLEEELQRSKEEHQATIEQYETQTEELKASNEEMQAMNEELRSATEELETGKEELQSVNEEIQTINSELKQNIDELAIANSDLQNLITSTDLATIFVDSDLNIRFFTPRAQDLFNLIPSDVGRSLSDITHKLYYADMLQDVGQVLEDSHKTEREVESRDRRWYIAQVTPYHAAADGIKGVILTFIDFTARRHAEGSLLEARERLGLLVDSAMDHAIYTMDANGRIDYWNTGAQALFGYTENEVVGKSAALLFTPEDRERQELEREMREASEHGSVNDERWYTRKDGTRFYASGFLSLLSDERLKAGAAHGYAMIARDLTEQKTAADESIRFQAHLLDTVEQSVIATNLDGIVIYWNQFAQTLYGWTAEEAIGRQIIELTTPEMWVEPALEIMSRLRQGKSWAGEFNVQRRDGTTFPAQIINSPIIDNEGNLIGIVGVSTNISERKQAEETLRSSEAELQRSHQELERRVEERTAALSEMNAVLQEEVRERRRIEAERVELLRRIVFAQEVERRRIAREMHDQFGQQLTALKLKLDAMKEDCDENEKLCVQVEALQTLATQLDVDVDHMVWEIRPMALDDLGLQAALSSYVQNWSKHFGIQVELHASGMDKGRFTPEIETALYRIAQEALNNVAKHAEAKTVAVVLERRANQVSLIIEDNGRGFDLQQVLGADDAGLGLIGMRERAALVGGTIEIESQPDDGTTVVVRIPVTHASQTGETDE